MAVGDYGVVDKIKKLCDIDQATTKYDSDIEDAKDSGNRYLGDILFKYASTLPLTDDQKTSAHWVVNYHGVLIYKMSRSAPAEVLKGWKDLRNESKEALIEKLKAQPETNTQSAVVAVASTYKTQPLKQRSNLT